MAGEQVLPHTPCILVRAHLGLLGAEEYAVSIPVPSQEAMMVLEQAESSGEEYVKRWIGDRVHGVLGDLHQNAATVRVGGRYEPGLDPADTGISVRLSFAEDIGAEDFHTVVTIPESTARDMARHVGPRGADERLRRWVGWYVKSVLGDLDDRAELFSSFEMSTDRARDGWTVRGFVPRSAFDHLPSQPSSSRVLDVVRRAAARLVRGADWPRPGSKDHYGGAMLRRFGSDQDVAYWRGLYNDELKRNLALQSELRDLKESPRSRTVEELSAALETSDEARRVQEREIERMDSHNETLLQRNV